MKESNQPVEILGKLIGHCSELDYDSEYLISYNDFIPLPENNIKKGTLCVNLETGYCSVYDKSYEDSEEPCQKFMIKMTGMEILDDYGLI